MQSFMIWQYLLVKAVTNIITCIAQQCRVPQQTECLLIMKWANAVQALALPRHRAQVSDGSSTSLTCTSICFTQVSNPVSPVLLPLQIKNSRHRCFIGAILSKFGDTVWNSPCYNPLKHDFVQMKHLTYLWISHSSAAFYSLGLKNHLF